MQPVGDNDIVLLLFHAAKIRKSRELGVRSWEFFCNFALERTTDNGQQTTERYESDWFY